MIPQKWKNEKHLDINGIWKSSFSLLTSFKYRKKKSHQYNSKVTLPAQCPPTWCKGSCAAAATERSSAITSLFVKASRCGFCEITVINTRLRVQAAAAKRTGKKAEEEAALWVLGWHQRAVPDCSYGSSWETPRALLLPRLACHYGRVSPRGCPPLLSVRSSRLFASCFHT